MLPGVDRGAESPRHRGGPDNGTATQSRRQAGCATSLTWDSYATSSMWDPRVGRLRQVITRLGAPRHRCGT